MVGEIVHLDIKVTEDFIHGKRSVKGATRSTGTHLFLHDYPIAYRDKDGQVYAIKHAEELGLEKWSWEGIDR